LLDSPSIEVLLLVLLRKTKIVGKTDMIYENQNWVFGGDEKILSINPHKIITGSPR
jgi:hypothetical protein